MAFIDVQFYKCNVVKYPNNVKNATIKAAFIKITYLLDLMMINLFLKLRYPLQIIAANTLKTSRVYALTYNKNYAKPILISQYTMELKFRLHSFRSLYIR